MDLPLGKDGGVRNAEVSTLSAIPLSQFRYAHCQLPLGKGAFRPRANLPYKLQFIFRTTTLKEGETECFPAFSQTTLSAYHVTLRLVMLSEAMGGVETSAF